MTRGRALGSLFKLRPGELRPVGLLFLWFYGQIGALWAGRAVRDTLFLVHESPARLPYMYIATPLAVSLVGYIYAQVADRYRRDRLVMATSIFVGAVYLVFRVLLAAEVGRWIYYVLYVLVDVFGAICAMQLWMVAADLYTARDAKRVFGLIAAGGTVANVTMGLFVASLAKRLGTENMLFASSALCFVNVGLAWLLRRTSGGQIGRARPRPLVARAVGPRPKFKTIPGAGHLTLVALVIVTSVLTVTSLDFQYKSIAAAALHNDQGSIMRFFGELSIVSGLLAMTVQFTLTGRLLTRIGVAGTLLILPAFLSLGALGLLLVPGLAAAAFCKGSDQTFRYTLNDAGMQLLYLPVPQAVRSRAKATLDAFIRPTIEAGVGVGLLVYRAFATSLLPIAGAALAFAVVWVVNIWRLRGAYVHSLRDIMRRRRLDLSDDPDNLRTPLDATAAIRRALGSTDDDEIVNALSLAAEIGAEASDPLGAALVPLFAHANPSIRALACQSASLGEVRQLVDRLSDPDPACAPPRSARARASASATRFVRSSPMPSRPCAPPRSAACILPTTRSPRSPPLPKARRPSVRSPRRSWATSPSPRRSRRSSPTAMPPVLAAALCCRRAGALGRLARAPLIALLTRRGHARAAALALAAAGPDVEAFIAARVADPATTAAERRELPRVLALLGTPEAAEILLAQLDSADDALRGAAGRALVQARRNHPSLALPRTRLMAACDAELLRAYTTLAAAEGLGHAETSANVDGSRRPVPYLPKVPEGATALISRTLRERSENARDRVLILVELLDPDAEMGVVRANLADADPGRRANAVELLDSVLDRRLRRLLIPLVDDSPRYTKLKAAEASLELPRRAREAWVATLLADENTWMVACAAYYAGMTDVIAALPALGALGTHPSPLVRETAALAVARLAA